MGKSAFLQAFLGHRLGVRIVAAPAPHWELKGAEVSQRTLGSANQGSSLLSTQEARDRPEKSPMHTINTVQVSGQEKYLIVSEGTCIGS